MTQVQEPPTDFSGLAGVAQRPEMYSGLTDVEDATKKGEYEKNTEGLRGPWRLPIYRPPVISQVF
jgi:hypothetical protein